MRAAERLDRHQTRLVRRRLYPHASYLLLFSVDLPPPPQAAERYTMALAVRLLAQSTADPTFRQFQPLLPTTPALRHLPAPLCVVVSGGYHPALPAAGKDVFLRTLTPSLQP